MRLDHLGMSYDDAKGLLRAATEDYMAKLAVAGYITPPGVDKATQELITNIQVVMAGAFARVVESNNQKILADLRDAGFLK